MLKIISVFSFFVCLSHSVIANTELSALQEAFIFQMEEKHGFDVGNLRTIFKQVIVSQSILTAISKPAEKLPWYRYRNIFLKEKRIRKGVEFRQKYHNQLKQAEERFGVPPEIITAIIGIETVYGQNTGRYRVMDALNTLAFYYPKRSDFFRSELEQFLLLTREQGIQPLSLKGSYAGAMGIPQFISSSYRHYAIDFDDDNIIDIWTNPDDAIGSVAHYFIKHGWQKGEPIITKVSVNGVRYKQALTGSLEPNLNPAELTDLGIIYRVKFKDTEKLKLLEYELKNGKKEYWLAHHNFYVITRYNHSQLYAMAVLQLAIEIKKRVGLSAKKYE